MSVWNFTIDDGSPFFTYTPYADGSNSGLTKGWEPWYSLSGYISENGQAGAGDSYHITALSGASVNLEFYGTAVYLYGSTNGSYDTMLDNKAYDHATLLASNSPSDDLLLSITGLKEDKHSVTLIAQPTSANQQLAFDRAVISTPLVNNQTPAEAFYDNEFTTVVKYTGDWSSAIAPGVPNATVTHPWQETFVAGASVSMDIPVGAVGVAARGLTDWGNWLYNVSLDGADPTTFNGSTFWEVPDAMLFYQGGLDPTVAHNITLTNATPKGKLALNSFRVYNAPATPSSSASAVGISPSSSGTGTASPHSSVKAGVIVGPIVGVLLTGILLFALLHWRSKRRRTPPIASPIEAKSDGYPLPYTDQAPPGLLPVPHMPSIADHSSPYGASTYFHSEPSQAVVGPPGAVVMSWGLSLASPPYEDSAHLSSPRPGASPSSSRSDDTDATPSTSAGIGPTSPITPYVRKGPVHVSSPPLLSVSENTPDVDRLIELIAQRIDRSRLGGQEEDAVSPPEYRG